MSTRATGRYERTTVAGEEVAANIRIVDDSIVEIGPLTPQPADRVFDTTGLVVAPGVRGG